MARGSEVPGLYVHVPFCVSKCRYCGFFSETGAHDRQGWVSSVVREAAAYRDRFEAFDTLYLGGGTPSVLGDGELETLLRGLRRALPLADDAEVTVELNPGDVSLARARRWVDLGIPRASVGVQSFDDASLSFLGRRHDGATAFRVLEDLRTAGFGSVGVDLIWALPGTGAESAWASLERALAFEPEHLSCYELTVEDGTALARDVAQGLVVPVPNDEAAEFALAYWGRLAEAGYDHYEVSNFARGLQHRSRHNTKYWRHVPYLGLGPAAHSFDGRVRWSNVRSVSGYRDAVARDGRAVVFEEVLSERQKRFERVSLGVRTSDGVEACWVDLRCVPPLVREGLVVTQQGRIAPTERGMLVADALARELVLDTP